jgi:hypothetical protein
MAVTLGEITDVNRERSGDPGAARRAGAGPVSLAQ